MERLLSRKFLVFATATALVLFGKISDAVWLAVALAYMGANILAKWVRR